MGLWFLLRKIEVGFLSKIETDDQIIYGQPQNESFCEKLESVQYKVALAIKGSTREKIYQELGFESLKSRRW